MEKRSVHITFNAPVILVFCLLCFLATLAGVLTGGRSTSLFFMTYRSAVSPLAVLRLFTHVFGHTGWTHLIGNLVYILLVGPMLEEKFGHLKIVLIMVITAFATGLINVIFFPTVALCGASGIVFALILLSSFSGYRERGEIPLTFIVIAVLFIGQQVYQGIVVDDNISNLAHIVGGVIGSICGFIFTRKKTEADAADLSAARAAERAERMAGREQIPAFSDEVAQSLAKKERGERGLFGRKKKAEPAEEPSAADGIVSVDTAADPFEGLRPASVTGAEPEAPEHTAPDPTLPEVTPAQTAEAEMSGALSGTQEEDAPSFDQLFPDLKTSDDLS